MVGKQRSQTSPFRGVASRSGFTASIFARTLNKMRASSPCTGTCSRFWSGLRSTGIRCCMKSVYRAVVERSRRGTRFGRAPCRLSRLMRRRTGARRSGRLGGLGTRSPRPVAWASAPVSRVSGVSLVLLVVVDAPHHVHPFDGRSGRVAQSAARGRLPPGEDFREPSKEHRAKGCFDHRRADEHQLPSASWF